MSEDLGTRPAPVDTLGVGTRVKHPDYDYAQVVDEDFIAYRKSAVMVFYIDWTPNHINKRDGLPIPEELSGGWTEMTLVYQAVERYRKSKP
jgi:hypothetical protein